MRRAVALVAVVVFVDTAFYAALAPILPGLEQELGLDKAGSGILVAAYPVGTMLGALPGGWLAARFGARPVVLFGLCLMATAGITFALGQSAGVLIGARFVQGLGGACSWTAGLAWLAQVAPPGRRGELLGIGIGAGIVGAQFGPVVGTIADVAGREATFLGAALLGLPLILWTLATPAPHRPEGTTGAHPWRLARDRGFLVGVWFTAVPSFVFGVAEVLLPLRMDDLGASALGIGLGFFLAAGVEAAMSPIVGRLADRRGSAAIVRAGSLLAAACLLLLTLPQSPELLAAVFIVASAGLGALWVPASAIVSNRAESLGVDQGWAFAVNNVFWSGGVAVGAVAGGALGQAVGDGAPYTIIAVLLILTALVVVPRAPADGPHAEGEPIRAVL